jgi:hypothetical protein
MVNVDRAMAMPYTYAVRRGSARKRHRMATAQNYRLAVQIADDTDGAYSRYAYSARAWRQIAQHLLDIGYSAAAATEVLRSKHTRWFRDGLDDNQAPTAKRFASYVKKNRASIDGMLVRECGMPDYLIRKPTRSELRSLERAERDADREQAEYERAHGDAPVLDRNGGRS